MKKLSIAFVAVLLAIAGSSFTTKFFAETAPCDAVFFAQNKASFPTDVTVDRTHLTFTATDSDNDNLPDEIQYTQGQTLPAAYDCPVKVNFICAVGYAASDVEERASDGKWVPKSTATPICVIRYN